MHLPLPLRMLGLLMLILTQCGAEDYCSPDPSRLILDPPVIIQQYGANISLNCNSSLDNVQEMFLLIGNKSIATRDVRNHVSHRWPLTDWDVDVECRIKLNDSSECKRKAEIIVYQNPEVSLSTRILNASENETQYELQCDVINVAPVQNLIVTWYKNGDVFQIIPFSEAIKEPVNRSLSLIMNISRSENVVQLSCDAVLDLKPQGPQNHVTSGVHNVSAFYAPEGFANKLEVITVFVGDNVILTCDVEENPAPEFKWTIDEVNLPENTSKLEITHIVKSADYTCIATSVLGNVSKTFLVQVVDAASEKNSLTTPEPRQEIGCDLKLTPPEIVVKFGGPAAINCSTSYRGASIMGWESTVGPQLVRDQSFVLWKVDKVDTWDLKLICFGTFKTQCSASPVVTLYKTPDVVSVSAVDADPMTEGREYELQCKITNVAPVQNLTIKWYYNDTVVFTEQPKNISALPLDWFSTFTVTPKRSDNGSVFRCEADLDLKPVGPDFNRSTFSLPYIAVVQYRPFFNNCLDHYNLKEGFSISNLSCETDGNPPPTVIWYYQDKRIDPHQPLNRTQSGNYAAEVTNSIGKNSTSVRITVEYGPSFACEEQYEVDVNTDVRVPCKIEGLPTPTVTWFKSGEEIRFPRHWGQEDSGNYSLKAENKHGVVEHRLHVDVLYAPKFKDGNTSIEGIPGENVTLECSAEGNPSPDVQWKYPLRRVVNGTAKGRQIIVITVPKATSTDPNPYMCVATNKVGTETRYVFVTRKDTSCRPFNYLWLLFLLVPIIVGILLYMLKNGNKRGHYSFVMSENISLTKSTGP